MAFQITYGSALCYTPTFTVNGRDARYTDFGSKYDADPDNAPDYGCGDMTFEPQAPDAAVLEKYQIDELEYWSIANSLKEGLSFGCCELCS